MVGRAAFRLLRSAREIVQEAHKLTSKDLDTIKIPQTHNLKVDTLYLAQQLKAFELLDVKNQDMPFHSAEITLQVLTAMLFADFDFEKTLIFLVNLGRDNDTTSAVAGGILGAYWGFDKLPASMKTKILKVNKELLDTDLEALAQQMTDKILSR